MLRERWIVRNIFNKTITIGDLSKCPAIPTGKAIDLLAYHTKTEIEQSIVLRTLLLNEYLRLEKDQDNEITTYTGSDAVDSITISEDSQSGGGGGTVEWGDIEGTLTNQTDLQAALSAIKQVKTFTNSNTATPSYLGQLGVNTNNGYVYYSYGTGSGEWNELPYLIDSGSIASTSGINGDIQAALDTKADQWASNVLADGIWNMADTVQLAAFDSGQNCWILASGVDIASTVNINSTIQSAIDAVASDASAALANSQAAQDGLASKLDISGDISSTSGINSDISSAISGFVSGGGDAFFTTLSVNTIKTDIYQNGNGDDFASFDTDLWAFQLFNVQDITMFGGIYSNIWLIDTNGGALFSMVKISGDEPISGPNEGTLEGVMYWNIDGRFYGHNGSEFRAFIQADGINPDNVTLDMITASALIVGGVSVIDESIVPSLVSGTYTVASITSITVTNGLITEIV